MIIQNIMNDAVFKYVLAIVFFILGLILYGFANSNNLNWHTIYTLQKPLQLKSDGIHPSIFSVPIKIEAHTKYLLKAKISGNPEVRFDFWSGKEYDSPKQEMAAPKGEKKNFVINTILDSDSTPVIGSVSLRVFHTSKAKENVEVNELALYEELFNYGYYIRIIATILAISSLILLLLASKYQGQLFYFILLSAIAFTSYAPVQKANKNDNMWYIPQVLSLIIEQNIDINEYPDQIKQVNQYAVKNISKTKLNFFPYGTVLVNYPLTLVTKHFFNCNLSTETEKIACGFKIAELNAKILASMSVGFMFLIVLAMTNSLTTSWLLALIFAFASPHFSNHAGGLWSHNTTVFLITAALFTMLQTSTYTYLAAIPLFLSYVARPSMSISMVILSMYYIISNRNNLSAIAKYVTFLILMGAIFLVINLFVYNGILPPYYFANRLSFINFKNAIIGIFISPNRGLFVFFPIALFSFWGIYLTIRSLFNQKLQALNNNELIFVALSLLVLLHSFIYSLFPHWWMGYSYGPRMFAEIVPYLILLLIPTLKYINTTQIVKWLFTICAIFSLYVQLIGAFNLEAQLWNVKPINVNPSRVWDWQDMQMFRWLR